jgi:Glyoxalase-like domain
MTLQSSFGNQNALFFDHAVLVVQDLDSATRQFQGMGFTVIPGGIHAGELTHNALIAFEEGSYLELLAPYSRRKYNSLRLLNRVGLLERHSSARTPLGRRFAESLIKGQGFNDFALGTSDLGDTIVQAGAHGLELEGPAPGSRIRPDGKPVSWRTACPASRDLPFLIEDVTLREARVPGGEAAQHPNQVSGVAAVTVAVADLASSTTRYTALLGEQPVNEASAAFTAPGSAVNCFLIQETILALEQWNNQDDKSRLLGSEAGRPQRIWLRSSNEKIGLLLLECSSGADNYPKSIFSCIHVE